MLSGPVPVQRIESDGTCLLADGRVMRLAVGSGNNLGVVPISTDTNSSSGSLPSVDQISNRSGVVRPPTLAELNLDQV